MTLRDVCDIAYELQRERYERAVLAVAGRVEEPFEFIDQRMAAFDEVLAHDPQNTDEAHAAARDRELLEEVA